MGCRESFRDKAFIRNRHRRSRNRQLGGQFPRGRQLFSRPKTPVQNCLPNLTIDLATEIASTNKADMERHSPGPSFFFLTLDWQPCIKVNVPSYRFADMVMVVATAGSVSERHVVWSTSRSRRHAGLPAAARRDVRPCARTGQRRAATARGTPSPNCSSRAVRARPACLARAYTAASALLSRGLKDELGDYLGL
jgi:hypothetical protein